MKAIMLIARREVFTRLRQRSLVVATMLIIVAILAAGVIFRIGYDSFMGTNKVVAVSAEAEELGELLKQVDPNANVVNLPPGMDLQQVAILGVDGKDVSYVLDGTIYAPKFISDGQPDPAQVAAIGTAARNAALLKMVHELDGNVGEVEQIVQESTPEIQDANDSVSLGSANFDPRRFTLGVAISTMLFFSILFGGSMLATGVVEEKSSRVIEVILAAVRPVQLLTGKILGISLVVIIQLTLFMAAAIGALSLAGQLHVLDGIWQSNLAIMIPWFLIGFITYALLFGSLSSLISRQEEIGAITSTLTLTVMIPFYLSLYLVPFEPNGWAARILSFIPLFSPFMMPMRHAFDTPMWEQVLAIILSVLMIPVLAFLAGRVYRYSVLRTGSRVKLRDALLDK